MDSYLQGGKLRSSSLLFGLLLVAVGLAALLNEVVNVTLGQAASVGLLLGGAVFLWVQFAARRNELPG